MSELLEHLDHYQKLCTSEGYYGSAVTMQEARVEIIRLSAAKTAALKIADERAIEAVQLRAKLERARKALEAVWFDQKKIGNCAPDTLDLVRDALTDEQRQP